MLHLDRTHDPRKNAELLAQMTQSRLPIKQKILKTEQLFKQACQKPIPVLPTKLSKQPRTFSEKMMEGLFRLFSKPSTLLNPSKIMVDEKEVVFPDWKEKLDRNLFQRFCFQDCRIQKYAGCRNYGRFRERTSSSRHFPR